MTSGLKVDLLIDLLQSAIEAIKCPGARAESNSIRSMIHDFEGQF